MRRSLPLVLTAALATLAACADDHPTTPAADAAEPGFLTVNSVCTTSRPLLGATPVDVTIVRYDTIAKRAGEWGPAIQRAVDENVSVRIPARDSVYTVKTPVVLPCNTRLFGEDRAWSVLRWQPASLTPHPAHGAYPVMLVARGLPANPVSNVTIDNLTFRAGAAELDRIAFRVFTGTNIVFRGNRAENMMLIDVSAHFDTLDYTTANRNATGARANTLNNVAGLSSAVTIASNQAQGSRTGGLAAINVSYARSVTVDSNTVSGYASGVQWWGGGIDVSTSSNPYPKWSYGHQIRHNTITDVTIGGIWGGMGRSIRVERNTVNRCDDVCLDAESSDSVTFYGNDARNAGNSILAAFWHSTAVVFDSNRVVVDNASFAQGQLFSTSTYQNATVTAKRNTFTYSPATGFGRVSKSSGKIYFHANTLQNVVIDFGTEGKNAAGQWEWLGYHGSPAGSVSIVGNTLGFTRVLAPSANLFRGGSPIAIFAAHNSFPSLDGSTWHVIISGNVISSTVAQAGAGIHDRQSRVGTLVRSYIEGNRVEDFGTSIVVERMGGDNHYFEVADNEVDAGVQRINTTNVNEYGTFDLSGGGGCADPTQPLCD